MQTKPVIRVQARYQADVHAWLAERAKRNSRSMNGELMYILKQVREEEKQEEQQEQE